MIREITELIECVLLTMIIELVVLFLLKVRDKRLCFSLIINLLTNLLLNSLLSFINTTWLYIFLLIIGEILVFLIEWFLYDLIIKDNKNWLYSLVTNLSSFLIGSPLIYLLFLFI